MKSRLRCYAKSRTVQDDIYIYIYIYSYNKLKAFMTIDVDVYCMVSILTFVRVLIPAVSKKTINPKLHIFNNCFDDKFSTRKWILH